MTRRTRKNERYRHYTCSTKARMGGCSGITVPMDKLDGGVVEQLERWLIGISVQPPVSPHGWLTPSPTAVV